jgi:hypothetical protein
MGRDNSREGGGASDLHVGRAAELCDGVVEQAPGGGSGRAQRVVVRLALLQRLHRAARVGQRRHRSGHEQPLRARGAWGHVRGTPWVTSAERRGSRGRVRRARGRGSTASMRSAASTARRAVLMARVAEAGPSSAASLISRSRCTSSETTTWPRAPRPAPAVSPRRGCGRLFAPRGPATRCQPLYTAVSTTLKGGRARRPWSGTRRVSARASPQARPRRACGAAHRVPRAGRAPAAIVNI